MPSYTRRQVLEGLSALSAASLMPRASFAAPASPQPVPTGPSIAATVTLSATQVGEIGPAFAGFSYEKSQLAHPLFRPANKDLIALFRLLGPSLLRVGGDSSDKIVWTPSGTGGIYKQVTPAEVAALAAFVKATGWKCLYTVNLAGSANASTSPELAAAEVAYAAQQFGGSLYGIEIGNEPDSYIKAGRQYDGKEWNLQIYETTWNQYRSAILEKTPGVFVTGPAAGHLADWTIPFSKDQTRSRLGLLTDHYYRGHPPASAFTVDKLIGTDPTLLNNLKMMREAQQVTGIPFRLGEANSFTSGDPGVSDAYASSLWAVDFLFTCAIGGAQGINFHGGRSASYTPIEDDQEKVLAVKPEFYGMLFFSLAGTGPLQQTEVSAASLMVSAYAVKTAAGTSVMVVNKDATQNLNLTIKLPAPAKSATLMGLTGSSLSATSGVAIQGATIAVDGTFKPAPAYTLAPSGSQLTCYVPALSAALIKLG